MNVLLDTNVLLDFILERESFVQDAEQVLETAKQQSIQLFMTATTITDLFYIAKKDIGKERSLEIIEDLLQFVEVAAVDKQIILDALHSELPDFEDSVQESASIQAGVNIIVTRNEADFKNSALDIYSPHDFVSIYGSSG